MKVLSIILVMLGCLTFGGTFLASGAPQQAAGAGMACFFGILARIAQASGNHSELFKSLGHKEKGNVFLKEVETV